MQLLVYSSYWICGLSIYNCGLFINKYMFVICFKAYICSIYLAILLCNVFQFSFVSKVYFALYFVSFKCLSFSQTLFPHIIQYSEICDLSCIVEVNIGQQKQARNPKSSLWRDLRRLIGPWPGMNKVILTSHYDAIIRHQFGSERWKTVPSPPPPPPPPTQGSIYIYFSKQTFSSVHVMFTLCMHEQKALISSLCL